MVAPKGKNLPYWTPLKPEFEHNYRAHNGAYLCSCMLGCGGGMCREVLHAFREAGIILRHQFVEE